MLVEYRITTDCERCYKDAITASAKLSLADSDIAHLVAVVDARNPEFMAQIAAALLFIGVYFCT